MSDVRYAFSDPCGMEMIIMVIIQHLNNPFSVRNTGKHICPGTQCWCLSATTNRSVLVRDIGGDREARLSKVMKRVQCLQFNWDKLGWGRKSCSTLYLIPSPHLPFLSYPWHLLTLKRLGWKWSTYQSSLSPSWEKAWTFSLFMVSTPPFVFPPRSSHLYALCIFWGQPCGLICMINFIPVFIPIIRWTEHHSFSDSGLLTGKFHNVDSPEGEWGGLSHLGSH